MQRSRRYGNTGVSTVRLSVQYKDREFMELCRMYEVYCSGNGFNSHLFLHVKCCSLYVSRVIQSNAVILIVNHSTLLSRVKYFTVNFLARKFIYK